MEFITTAWNFLRLKGYANTSWFKSLIRPSRWSTFSIFWWKILKCSVISTTTIFLRTNRFSMAFNMSTDFSSMFFFFFALGFWSISLWSLWVRSDILHFKQRNYPESDYSSDNNYHNPHVSLLNRAALGTKSHSIGLKWALYTQNIPGFKSRESIHLNSLKITGKNPYCSKESLQWFVCWIYYVFLVCVSQIRPFLFIEYKKVSRWWRRTISTTT